jgi:hypothetical protein
MSIMLPIAFLLAGQMSLPLTVDAVVPGTPGHARITNTSRQPITAWSLATTTQTEAGRTHREIYTADGYLSEVTHGLPNASNTLERLMPGESRELPLDSIPDGAKVEAIAVVMEDGTAIGDETALTAIFAKRAKERDGLKAVVDAFGAVLPEKHGQEALADLKMRFTALVQRDDNVPCHAALDAVQAYPSDADGGRIDQSLRTYADFVGREYALADKQASRKQ